MKNSFIYLFLLFGFYCFSQSVNDYKAIIIPLKYDFQKEENQYRLQTLTKVNLIKAGFQAFYSNESIPSEFNDRCSLLYLDVKNEKSFFVTKLFITLKDCYNTVIFQSPIGKSREKEFELAYVGALNDAFDAVNALGYKFNGRENNNSKTFINQQSAHQEVVVLEKEVSASGNKTIESKKVQSISSELLYAQPTSFGFQLIDSEPKVVMKVYKTSNLDCFMAIKGSIQGVLVAKNNQWFFEYYENDKFISEMVNLKF